MATDRSQTVKKGAWKVKSLRSTFGPQCLAQLQTAPAASFGSSPRDAAAKTYISPAIDKAKVKGAGGNNSPGPAYIQPSTMGPQCLSTLRSAPRLGFPGAKRSELASKAATPGPGAYRAAAAAGTVAGGAVVSTMPNKPVARFGHAPRDAQQLLFISKEHDRTGGGRDSPGPGSYNTAAPLVGRALLSTQPAAPVARIGSAARFASAAAADAAEIPGPGQYPGATAAVESRHTGQPAAGFPRAVRDAHKKIFISLEHEKAGYGEQSPGPGTASPVPALGRQLISKAKSAPTWSFGTGRRQPLAAGEGPGPGEYYA